MQIELLKRIALLVISFQILINLQSQAQQGNFKAFTVNDGLPSNYVYRAVEDDKGFLWVATDAGIARFDGKHFQVFTTEQGLPDNEVLAVVKEKNGRIWVNCFKQKPAYFDEVQNKFVNARNNNNLAKIKEGTSNMYFFPIETGGMMFVNEKGSTIFKDNQLFEFPSGKRNDDFLIKNYSDNSRLVQGNTFENNEPTIQKMVFYKTKEGKYIDSLIIREGNMLDYHSRSLNDGKYYLFFFDRAKCYIYSNFKTNPIRFTLDSVSIPESFNNFDFTPTSFYIVGNSGKIYLINKNTLQNEMVFSGNYLPNSIFNDKQGNLWMSTIDKGLLLYKKKQLLSLTIPESFKNKSFLSIAKMADGSILAGNFYGEIVQVNKQTFKVHEIPKRGKIARQRKIIISQNKVFSFSEAGIFVDYKNFLKHNPHGNFSYGKTAMLYSDSIIIVGQATIFSKLNTITEKVTILNGLGKRITALTRDLKGDIYFGSTDGLYKYDFEKNYSKSLVAIDPILTERITALCYTPDSLIWVATSGNGIVVLKNDKVITHLTLNEGLINNATKCILATKGNQVGLGTSSGISLINYQLNNNRITFSIHNISVNDGLTNNVINEMLFQNDTIYAATGDGVSIIPANISIPKFNIPVVIQRVTINQRDTIISNAYTLSYQQKNIQIQLAGVELSGHFKNLEYRLDDQNNWTAISGNTLTLELNNGSHLLQVRAKDVNGYAGTKITKLQFDIATPFWKVYWFWILVIFFLQAFTIYYVSRWQKKQKKNKLAREIASVQTAALEQQAFTSLMNPHFIFNALNSIQHYINVQDRLSANRYLSDFASLIRKSFEAAQQYFIPLEEDLENIKIYLRLEQMRFSGKFSYQIVIDDKLDIERWMIPTMLLQPLLENALLHGIMPSDIDGVIFLEISLVNEELSIVITDNGIGIAKSRLLKNAQSHISHGMNLIRKRISALNHFGEVPIRMVITTAFESETNPGNRVTIIIPSELHKAWMMAQKK